MSRGAASAAAVALAADPQAMRDWLRGASSGERFTYCVGDRVQAGAAANLARSLQAEGLVRLHSPRNAAGLFDYLMVRTGKPLPDPSQPEPLDDASEAILRAMKRAVNLWMPCPSDAELAKLAGLETRDQAQWRVTKLRRAGLIETLQVTEDGSTTRVVSIRCADGSVKSSLPPPKMLAAQLAMKSERGK